MDESPSNVICPATFEILLADQPPSPILCELSYDAGDPFAVTARFALADQSVAWTFARSLLRTGMYEPVGDGDISVRPGLSRDGHATVYVELNSPHGTAMLRTRTARIAAFLDMTQQVVPIGAELDGVDMDAVISQLVQEASA